MAEEFTEPKIIWTTITTCYRVVRVAKFSIEVEQYHGKDALGVEKWLKVDRETELRILMQTAIEIDEKLEQKTNSNSLNYMALEMAVDKLCDVGEITSVTEMQLLAKNTFVL